MGIWHHGYNRKEKGVSLLKVSDFDSYDEFLGKKEILDIDCLEFEYVGELDENGLACGQWGCSLEIQ